MATDRHAGEPPDGPDEAVAVRSCSRIGLRASAPGFQFNLGWLRRPQRS